MWRGLGLSGCPFRLKGDSISALTWASRRRRREARKHIMYRWYSAWLRSSGELLVPFEFFEFVSSIDSFRRDAMSRDTAIADLNIGGLIVSVPISRQRYSKHWSFAFSTQADRTSDEVIFEYGVALRAFLNEGIVVASQCDCTTMLGGVSASSEDPNNSRLTACR